MIYTEEFLLEKLKKFYEKYNRSPKHDDYRYYEELVSPTPYKKIFGTWNNALRKANLPLNLYQEQLTGKEKCEHCGCENPLQWSFKYNKENDKFIRLCRSCYDGYDYKYGKLDPKSNVGVGFIAEKIVYNTLENSKHCNLETKFNEKYDIYNNEYEKIDVKSAIIISNKWNYKLKNKNIPDNYFFIAFDDNRKNIEHLWIINNEEKILQNKQKISISNSKKGLSRVKEFEVDVKPYNDTYHSMSIDNCPILRKE